MSEYESSLTSPTDRDKDTKWRPDVGAPPLTKDELKNASEVLNVRDFYPVVDRVYADPKIPQQNIVLFSFVPSKGATPDKDGFYGFAKVRGVYDKEEEATQRADELIRNVDSYHRIFHAPVGRPFPITTLEKFSADHHEVDLKKKTEDTMSNSVKQEREKELKDMRDIRERERKLKEDVKKEIDPIDRYTELRVKKAQLSWTFMDIDKRKEEVKRLIFKARADLAEMDNKHPEFKDLYYEKYCKAREDAGLQEDATTRADNFMKYLVEDADLGF